MRLEDVVIKGETFTFVCETWGRGNAWGHKATLLLDGEERGSASFRYYNRTWEAHQYDAVKRVCINKIIQEAIDRAIQTHRELGELRRFKRGERAAIVETVRSSKLVQKLVELQSHNL